MGPPMDENRGKRNLPAGVFVVAAIVVLAGLRALAPDPGETSPMVHAIQLALGLLSLVVGWAIWTGQRDALTAYFGWVVAGLVGGGIVQLVAEGEPLLHVAIWWVFAGAVWVAVGLYLRSAFRRADGGSKGRPTGRPT